MYVPRPPLRHRRGPIGLGLLAVAATLILVAIPRPRHGSDPGPAPLADVVVEAPDHSALRAADAELRLAEPTALRFAVPLDVHVSPASHGSWTAIDGGRRWRVTLASPDAHTTGVAIDARGLPAGATFRVTDPDGAHAHGPWTVDDVPADGELYSPPVPGDAIVVELDLPDGLAVPPVTIVSVQHDYRGFGPTLAGLLDEARAERQGSCNVDVACDLADPWRDQVRSVGVLTVRGAWMCTGSLVASLGDGPPRPYFLTAFHCGITADNDHAVRVYWNYESPTCGERCCGEVTRSQAGSTLRARYRESDFCLLELDQRPAPDAHAFFSGFDARDDHVPSEVVAIHHPSTDEKAISTSDDPLLVSSYLGFFGNGDGTHWRVDDWEIGTTEPGSSGSGLWDENGRLVGQLHGGDASCDDRDLSDWYGRLSVSWEGGGTPDTRLRDWLDPDGTGARVADGRDLLPISPTSTTPTVEPPALARIGGLRPNPVKGKFVLRFEVDVPGEVGLEVVDVTGRAVPLIPSRTRSAGEHLEVLDTGSDGLHRLGAGVYFVRLVRDGIPADMTRLVILP